MANKRERRFKCLVSLDVPDGVHRNTAMDYIRDAVRSWSGSFEPPNEEGNGDPRFGMGRDVTVIPYNHPNPDEPGGVNDPDGWRR